jgi:hypothetical protein
MNKTLIAYLVISVTELIVASIYGPRSCDGGFEIYFWTGIFCVIVSAGIPFTAKSETIKWKIGFSILLSIVSVLIWVGGFALGNFRIICRLF